MKYLKNTILYMAFCVAMSALAEETDLAVKTNMLARWAASGYAPAQYAYGISLLNGADCEESNEAGMEWIRKAADGGDADAQILLGACYFRGERVKKDWKLSLPLVSKAAKSGHPEAQFVLGEFYWNGFVVEKSPKEAAALYAKAAHGGYAPAYSRLGYCHEIGAGVAQDNGKAFELYRQGALKGDAEAQSNYGRFLSQGIATKTNEVAGAFWAYKAAEQKNPSGMFNLAMCYVLGSGVKQDVAYGIRLAHLAAESGCVNAQLYVGLMYEDKDNEKAEFWLKAAAENGNAQAAEALKKRSRRHQRQVK